MTKLVQSSQDRFEVYADDGHKLGYIVGMIPGLLAIDPVTGKKVEFFCCPERGGLERAYNLELAKAETKDEAIDNLVKMDECPGE